MFRTHLKGPDSVQRIQRSTVLKGFVELDWQKAIATGYVPYTIPTQCDLTRVFPVPQLVDRTEA